MINSQLPSDRLPALKDIEISEDIILRRALDECREALFHLNGYLEALTSEERLSYCNLIKVCEHRHSFDLESYSVSMIRLFEAGSSENFMKDDKVIRIYKAIEKFDELEFVSVRSLEPGYMPGYRNSGDLLRERKESRITSYFTNLTLYTAPMITSKIRALREDLDKHLQKGSQSDELLNICLSHFQFRALAPYTVMNGHAARTAMHAALGKLGLLYDILPVSQCINASKEIYNTLMRDTLQSGNYSAWCVYSLGVMRDAARIMLDKMRRLRVLRKKLGDQISKHSDYKLPSAGLKHLLLSGPFVKTAMLVKEIGCHRQSAYVYLEHLKNMGILTEKGSGREKLYLHKELLTILSD